MQHAVSIPFVASFANEGARERWELALPYLWRRYFEVVESLERTTVGGACRPLAGGDVAQDDECMVRAQEQGVAGSWGDGLHGVVGTSGRSAGDSSGVGGVGLFRGGVEGNSCDGGPQVVDVEGRRERSVEGCEVGRGGGHTSRGVVDEIPQVSGSAAGRWASSNRKKKIRRRAAKAVPEWRRTASPLRDGLQTGFCETVVSQCPSYSQAMSDAEREAKESLAKRRAAENALQEKLAKMKLADLEDEQKCQEYAQLKRQRVIQWTNEATAKSQQSLDKCKSIDPGSSSSQFEIRKQAKELADTKMQYEHLVKVFHDAVPDAAKIIAMTKLPGTESMERYQFEGEFIGGWGDDHSISS